jgi:hypothetical protein
MPRAVNLLAILTLIGAALAPGSFGAAYAEAGPSPFLRAFPDGNAVDGGNWPLDASVHLAIDDPATTEIAPDYEQDATVIVSPWDWISRVDPIVKTRKWGELRCGWPFSSPEK